MLPPPSTRARLPAPVRCTVAMLLAFVFGKTDTNAIDLTKPNSDSKYAIDHFFTLQFSKQCDDLIRQ
jgi:hypothetical protein